MRAQFTSVYLNRPRISLYLIYKQRRPLSERLILVNKRHAYRRNTSLRPSGRLKDVFQTADCNAYLDWAIQFPNLRERNLGVPPGSGPRDQSIGRKPLRESFAAFPADMSMKDSVLLAHIGDGDV